jgi:hypothetical protein
VVRVGDTVEWRTWCGRARVTVTYVNGDASRVHLRSSDGHVEFHDGLPRGAEVLGQPYQGVCDGCPSGRPQTVRDVSGPWGAATVCEWHEAHEE